jgi:hypothetical protein
VKLVLACCILHNWILDWGEDEYVPDVDDVTPDGDEVDMMSSKATFRLGRTRGTTGLRQYGRIELMSSTVDTEARIKVCTPLGCHCRTVPRYVMLTVICK